MTADERKPVTVLFADLAGSTELATRHDPEPLRALLGAFFDEMRQQVEAYGGTVEKYAGDSVMAVFGVPAVHEDDAERAVRAGVAMREAVAQLNPMFEQEYGVRLALRIGIASGEAVAASRPTSEFMVTGEVPNRAARLQVLADGLLVDAETYRLLAPLLEAEPAGPFTLKGFAEPVAAWQVRGLQAGGTRPRGIPGLTSPVVGRERELAALRACIEELQRGRGQIVTVIGEAGIGKSRVKIEVRDNLPAEVRWLEGRCQSYTQTSSYAPVVEIFRAALGLTGAESPTIARTKLRAALRGVAGDRTEALLGALADVLTVDLGGGGIAAPIDPRARQAQLVLATRAVLEGLAQRGPVVVAVEDLHWADTASVELLTVLAELTDFQPLMILVTSRPETEGEAWTFRLHVERNYGHRLTELRLAPLASSDSERLADNLLQVSELPEAIRRRILERAEGNPFFLEEIVRALIEQGVLRRDGDRWQATAEPERWAIPTTVRGVLAARVDALPAPAKRALQHASVIGRFFEWRTLQTVSEEPGELDRALAHLLRAELVREWARLPERQYVFKHALTQEAAYVSMLGEERKRLHARVAAHLEAVHGEAASEHAAMLAHHWERAEDWERALRHTVSAAARARALYARPEALQLHWKAIDLLARVPATAEHRRTFVEIVLDLMPLPGWSRTAEERARGMRLLEEARGVAEELADGDLLARAEALLGLVSRDESRFARARAQARSRLAQAIVAAWYNLHLGYNGRYTDALGEARTAIELYGAEGRLFDQATQISFGGRCWAARAGRLEESVAQAARLREMAERLDDSRLRALRAMEAEPYMYLGRWTDVVRVVEESLPLAFEIAEVPSVMFSSAWLGLAYLKLGRREDARRVLDRALRWGEARTGMTPFAVTYVMLMRALAYLSDGEAESVTALARRALAMAEQGRFALERGAALRVLGQAEERQGRRTEAEAAFRQSLGVLEGIQSLPELGQTLLAYGAFRFGDDAAEGRRLVERARAIFESIGASGWMAEADALLR